VAIMLDVHPIYRDAARAFIAQQAPAPSRNPGFTPDIRPRAVEAMANWLESATPCGISYQRDAAAMLRLLSERAQQAKDGAA